MNLFKELENVLKWRTDSDTNLTIVCEIGLIEKLFPNSVTVLNNAPYCSIQENKISFSVNMNKDQLFDLIECYKSAEKIFHIDRWT